MAGDEEGQDRRGGGRQRGLALVLALLLALAVGFLAFHLQGQYQLPLLVVAANRLWFAGIL